MATTAAIPDLDRLRPAGTKRSSKRDLIAANHTVPQIAKTLGVDSLAYLTIDGMLSAMPGGPGGFCHACFSGRYPVKPPRGFDEERAGGA